LLSDPADRIRVAAADALGVLKSADSGELLLESLCRTRTTKSGARRLRRSAKPE
jgi:HEAT repeat protein